MKKNSIRLFDTHSHPQFPQYDHDRDMVISAARDAGIGIVCVGTDLETSRAAINLSERYESVFASVGVHPNDALDEAIDFEELKRLAQHTKVVAIGETGLDFYRTTDEQARATQHQRFSEHMRIAGELDLPLIIHCRDGADASAHSDILRILGARPVAAKPLYGVVHSFTGTPEQAKQYIELGFAIGLNGIVTFASEYEEMVRSVPVGSILLETDAPFLAPAPYRGKRNEPLYIIEVAKRIAEIKGIHIETLLDASLANTLRTFSKVYI